MSIGILTTRLYMDRIAALDGKDKKSGNETQGNAFRTDAACWKQTCHYSSFRALDLVRHSNHSFNPPSWSLKSPDLLHNILYG
jgi:hypothetical protein